jgi:hypothetical protein
MEESGQLRGAVALPVAKEPLVPTVTHSRSECFEEKNILPASGNEPGLKSRPNRSMITIRTTPSRFLRHTHVICSVKNAIMSAIM